MLLADVSEPQDMTDMLAKSVEVTLAPLNQNERADYWFAGYEGRTFQFSRKQAGELLGDIDEAERQLARYYYSADMTVQIVEGIISPVQLPGHIVHGGDPLDIRGAGSHMYGYSLERYTRDMRGRGFKQLPVMYYAWRHRIACAGIPTYETVDWIETARLLISVYKNEQKPEESHSTLSRIIRPRIVLKEKDSFVESVMFMSHALKLGIGEERAKSLREKFRSLYQLVNASEEELMKCEGIGTEKARNMVRAFRGRVRIR